MEQDELRAYFEDFYVESFRLSPELDNALSTILDTKDPLDSLEFNPIEYINRMFPNGESQLWSFVLSPKQAAVIDAEERRSKTHGSAFLTA